MARTELAVSMTPTTHPGMRREEEEEEKPPWPRPTKLHALKHLRSFVAPPSPPLCVPFTNTEDSSPRCGAPRCSTYVPIFKHLPGAAGLRLPVPIIAEVDLYKHDPWDLPGGVGLEIDRGIVRETRDDKSPKVLQGDQSP
ncbi:hypothetical protein BHE74_00021276 [Ensete ventricosum]|nr:hypothetical protein BHE74_00021276 [Ensete ventricosum]